MQIDTMERELLLLVLVLRTPVGRGHLTKHGREQPVLSTAARPNKQRGDVLDPVHRALE
jgi:hypothetical protein